MSRTEGLLGGGGAVLITRLSSEPQCYQLPTLFLIALRHGIGEAQYIW